MRVNHYGAWSQKKQFDKQGIFYGDFHFSKQEGLRILDKWRRDFRIWAKRTIRDWALFTTRGSGLG